MGSASPASLTTVRPVSATIYALLMDVSRAIVSTKDSLALTTSASLVLPRASPASSTAPVKYAVASIINKHCQVLHVSFATIPTASRVMIAMLDLALVAKKAIVYLKDHANWIARVTAKFANKDFVFHVLNTITWIQMYKTLASHALTARSAQSATLPIQLPVLAVQTDTS